jgi:hypothetical protein
LKLGLLHEYVGDPLFDRILPLGRHLALLFDLHARSACHADQCPETSAQSDKADT